jgi:hypothetical protein
MNDLIRDFVFGVDEEGDLTFVRPSAKSFMINTVIEDLDPVLRDMLREGIEEIIRNCEEYLRRLA